MIQGQKIWSEDMISDMDFREISGRKIFTFTHMKCCFQISVKNSFLR